MLILYRHRRIHVEANIFLRLRRDGGASLYQSCYAMVESLPWSRAVSNFKLFFEFRERFTEPSVPTCLPTYVNGGWVKGFMSKT